MRIRMGGGDDGGMHIRMGGGGDEREELRVARAVMRRAADGSGDGGMHSRIGGGAGGGGDEGEDGGMQSRIGGDWGMQNRIGGGDVWLPLSAAAGAPAVAALRVALPPGTAAAAAARAALGRWDPWACAAASLLRASRVAEAAGPRLKHAAAAVAAVCRFAFADGGICISECAGGGARGDGGGGVGHRSGGRGTRRRAGGGDGPRADVRRAIRICLPVCPPQFDIWKPLSAGAPPYALPGNDLARWSLLVRARAAAQHNRARVTAPYAYAFPLWVITCAWVRRAVALRGRRPAHRVLRAARYVDMHSRTLAYAYPNGQGAARALSRRARWLRRRRRRPRWATVARGSF